MAPDPENTSKLGTTEGRMCGILAANLCDFFTREGDGGKGGFIMRTCPRDWADAEQILLETGIMREQPIGADGRRELPVFAMNASEMPDYLANSIRVGDARLPRLVQAFIAIACGYGEQLLSDGRDWFKPPSRYATAMIWLARCGYAERNREEFRWTEKIEAAMRANYLWTDDGEVTAEIEQARFDAECERVWSSMPDTLKQSVKSNKIDFFDLVKALALGWQDGQWKSYKLDEPFDLTGQVDLAKRIFEFARDKP